MRKKQSERDASVTRYLLETLREELAAWGSLVKKNWVASLAIVVACYLFAVMTRPFPPRDVYLAVGPPGTSSEVMGRKFVPYFQKEGITLHLVTAENTSQILDRLDKQQTHLDAGVATGGIATHGSHPNLRSLGSLEYLPIWMFYRGKELSADDSPDPIEYFSTKRVAVGIPGSTSEVMVRRLLSLTGIDIDRVPNIVKLPSQQAVDQLIQGDLDGAILVNGINGSAAQRLFRQPDVHVINFPYADAYDRRLPYLEKIVIPKGALDLVHRRPSYNLQTLAGTATLVIHKDLHPAVQEIFLMAAKPISAQTADNYFFAKPDYFPAYLDHSIEASPIAKRFYAEGTPWLTGYWLTGYLPIWLVSYLDRVWLVILGALAIALPVYKLFPSYRRLRSVIVVVSGFERIQAIEQQAGKSESVEELRELTRELNDLNVRSRDSWMSLEDRRLLYAMKSAISLVRQQIVGRIAELEATAGDGQAQPGGSNTGAGQ